MMTDIMVFFFFFLKQMHMKIDIGRFAYSVVSDHPAHSTQANLKRHFLFYVFFFCLEQVYFRTEPNVVVKCHLGLACTG